MSERAIKADDIKRSLAHLSAYFLMSLCQQKEKKKNKGKEGENSVLTRE